MSDLSIPTRAQGVRMAWAHGGEEDVSLKLPAVGPDVHQFLEEAGAFVPVESADGWHIVRREALAWVAVQRGDVEEDDALFDCHQAVTVEFAHLGPLRGELLYTPQEGQARPTDILNREDAYLRLWTTDVLYLIAKTAVFRVTENRQ